MRPHDDGSPVCLRKTLGIAYGGNVQKKDAYWAGQFFSIYMRIPELYAKFVGHRRAWMYWAINPDPHTRGVIFSLNGADEFMMLIKPERGHSGVDTVKVADWVKRTIGADIAVDILAYHPWHAGQALVAERYRAGRIFIAGDAAHLFTPTGGFGMNTGIDDSSNLAWKLAAVLQGWGGPRLLDSYEAERKPIGLRNTGASRKYASRMHDAVVPDNIEAEGPAGDAARAEAAKMTYVRYNHFNRAEDVDAVGVQIGGRYDGISRSSFPTARPRRMFFLRPTTRTSRAGFPAGGRRTCGSTIAAKWAARCSTDSAAVSRCCALVLTQWKRRRLSVRRQRAAFRSRSLMSRCRKGANFTAARLRSCAPINTSPGAAIDCLMMSMCCSHASPAFDQNRPPDGGEEWPRAAPNRPGRVPMNGSLCSGARCPLVRRQRLNS